MGAWSCCTVLPLGRRGPGSMTTQPRNYGHPGNEKEPEKKHPYLFYWLTGGLATILAAVIGVSIAHSSSGSTNSTAGPSGTSLGTGSASPGPGNTSSGSGGSSSGTSLPSGNGLLTSDDMGSIAGGFWQPLAADLQSMRFSCFPLPSQPNKVSGHRARFGRRGETVGSRRFLFLCRFGVAGLYELC